MIQIIITTDFDFNVFKNRDVNPLKFHFVRLPQMTEDTNMIVCQRHIADEIEEELNGLGVKYEVLGSWNRQGQFYDDEKEGSQKVVKPKKQEQLFTKERFKSKVKVKKDKDGNVIDEPLILNRVAGMGRIQIYEDELESVTVNETEKEKVLAK